MLRKLMIKFTNEGDFFREIDEDRHYFLVEAETIVNKIRIRLEKEKREVSPKGFELWLEGRQLIVTNVSFDSKETLEQQLVNTMLGSDAWKDEMKHKYINLLKEWAEEERQLFVNKEFEAFAVRFDEVLGDKSKETIPLLLEVNRIKKIFDDVSTKIEAGFFSEVENVIETVKIGYHAVMEKIKSELSGVEETKGTVVSKDNSFLKVRLNTWFGSENNFFRFSNYIVARYDSVSENRIPSLCSRFPLYQEIQNKLYREYTSQIGFEKALKLHDEMEKDFYEKYEAILSSGFTLDSDDSLVSLVISPVCNEHLMKLETFIFQLNQEEFDEQGDENGENRNEEDSLSKS